MTWPTVHDWAFACKAYLAAIAALYVAMSLGLERPYWAMASAYFAIQPLSGATRSKAISRAAGTLAAAAAVVALVPPLSAAPALLSLALALWVAAALYCALMDRGPSSYGFMVGGYTAAIIGFPAVTAPETIFDVALARVEEISIGIIAAALVGQIILPRPVSGALDARVGKWLGNATDWAVEILAGRADPTACTHHLAADAVEVDTIAGHLAYEGAVGQTQRFDRLRERMIMLLPCLASMADRFAALNGGRDIPTDVQALVTDLSTWVRTPLSPAKSLLARIATARATVAADWNGLILSSLLTRMRDLVQLLHDCALLRQELTETAPQAVELWFAPEATASATWHRDNVMALLSAFAAFVSTLVVCAVWIYSAWPDGAVAAQMVAVGCSFFATLDDPVPAIMSFMKWCFVAVIVDGILQFGVLPAATAFGSLVLVLAPVYILGGVMISMPKTTAIGRVLTAVGATLLALDSAYSADFTSFVNTSLAFILGLLMAAILTGLIRSVGADFTASRLLRLIWRELAVAAEQRGKRDRGRYLGVMLDRLGLIAPRLAGRSPVASTSSASALADIRIGLNIIDLRRSRHELTAAERTPIDAMLDALAAYYRARAARAGRRDESALLRAVDQALSAVAAAPSNQGRSDALLGLIGIRRGLFPNAAAFVMPQARLCPA